MRLIHIACGDLRRVAKDRWAVVWMLVMPLIFAFILGSAVDYGSLWRTNWIPIVDLDDSELSKLFIKQMHGEGYGPYTMDEHNIKEDRFACILVIPRGFGQKILKGENVKITFVNRKGSPKGVLDLQLCLTHAIVRFARGLAWADATGRVGAEERKQALKESLSRASLLSVERKGHRSLRPPAVGFYLSLPGLLVMFVVFMITAYGASTLMDDRMGGQFARLVAAPVSTFELYVGKILARILLALVQAFLLLTCGSLLFRMELGDYPVFLVSVVVSLAVFAGCLSILCGLLCQTEKQVSHVSLFIGLVLAALGGCCWPIEIVPDVFKIVARFTPSYWAMQGLLRVMYFNKSYEVLLLECPVLLGFAVAVLLVVLLFLRRLPNI